MMDLAELENLNLAHDLMQAGLRLSLVRAMTNTDTRSLRRWWKIIHGAKPPNGRLPESVLSFIRDADTSAKLSAFVAFHRQQHGIEAGPVSPRHLLSAWHEYQGLCGPTDFNAAYFAVRDTRAGIVALPFCRTCNASFLYDTGNKHTVRCPFCETG